MAIADLKNVLKLFGGSEISEDAQDELYKETLLMTLARAADADIHIHALEIDRIQEILKKHTGDDFSASDVRIAARAELYAESQLRKYLSSVRKKLKDSQRAEIIEALGEVFRSDEAVSPLEVDFFNGVADALDVTPAQVAGLMAGSVDG